jgi:hypothetical protein
LNLAPSSRILPVGHSTGTIHLPDRPPYHEVRTGWIRTHLDPGQHAVWQLAMLAGADPQRRPLDRDSLVEEAVDNGIARAEEITSLLTTQGLLVEVEADPAARIRFASVHRFVHQLSGLGNSPDAPEVMRIGWFDEPILELSATDYILWQCVGIDADLWSSCRSIASWADPDSAHSQDPTEILARVVDILPVLLAARAAYLDIVPRSS